jgi:hypothetical protein
VIWGPQHYLLVSEEISIGQGRRQKPGPAPAWQVTGPCGSIPRPRQVSGFLRISISAADSDRLFHVCGASGILRRMPGPSLAVYFHRNWSTRLQVSYLAAMHLSCVVETLEILEILECQSCLVESVRCPRTPMKRLSGATTLSPHGRIPRGRQNARKTSPIGMLACRF